LNVTEPQAAANVVSQQIDDLTIEISHHIEERENGDRRPSSGHR
jgi:hypothetical protein